jgi:hypothetical protein
VMGIENRFQFSEDWIEATVLPGHPRRPGQACAMLGADRSAKFQGQPMDLLPNGPEPSLIIGAGQIKERACMHLAGASVNEERCRRLILLQDLLNAAQINRQHINRHANVLDEGDRLGPAAQTIKTRQHRFAQLPQAFDLFLFECSHGVKGQAPSALETIRNL